MKKIVENSDLGIPYTTVLNKVVVKLAQSMLGINKINVLYDKTADKEGVEFAQAVLDRLKVTIRSHAGRLGNIPKSGAFILVANHPYGALDGLLLMTLIAGVRPDVKFLGNFLLTKIKPLNEFFLPIDPFNAQGKRNVTGIRQAVEHLQEGSPLIIFPAGQVSTFQKRFSKIEDREWSESAVKFMIRAGVPVIPVYIDGRNSLIFHLLGRIHPLFRTMRLPLELTNKQGQRIPIVLGSQVPASRLRHNKDVGQVRDLLRANVYTLKLTLTEEDETSPESAEREQKKAEKREKSRKKRVQGPDAAGTSAELPVLSDRGAVADELHAISEKRLLMQVGGMSLFCAPSMEIPRAIQEIRRIRGLVLRDTGELKGKRKSVYRHGEYDALYHHLFVWDSDNQMIVAASTVGFGDVLYDAKGFDGFYSYTLFEFSRHLTRVLRQSVEMGHSFIQPDYQRRTQVLLLLWRGIMMTLLRNPSYRYLIGPVSMPERYSVAAKWMLVDYIKEWYWNQQTAKLVMPRNGMSALGRPVLDPDLIRGIKGLEDIDKLIRDVEPLGQGVPILMKKYLQLGGKVVGFNVEPEAGMALDTMLMLDLCDVPKEKIDTVAKDFSMSREDVCGRFLMAEQIRD